MQLQEILELLEITPTHYNIIVIVAGILFVVSIFAMLKYGSDDNDTKLTVSVISMTIFLLVILGTLFYTDSAKKSALESAKITRSGDKIHIKSNSEFMKSADLDIIAEKDGYIYVDFQNKTYRIEDLSKKGN